MNVSHLLGGAALAALATVSIAVPVQAQDDAAVPVTAVDEEQVEETAAEIIVNGAITFRNRTEDANPVLSYDLEYFQRFEPVSVGEMMKRVPGVTFTSDVLEYDGVQFRGLPPGFTQVLINGRRAPGGESNGSFFVDRIPAEVVERIEIVRAPRADQPSTGIAGTLNIVTKEATSFEGGFAKAGALINEDGEIRPSAALAYAGKIGERTDYWMALNYQERRNPKKKASYVFGDVPTTDDKRFPGNPEESNYIDDPEFDEFASESDTRDGSDLSGSAEISTELANGGRLRLSGFFVDTDRDEDEIVKTYEDDTLDYVQIETQHEDIKQQTYAITGDARIPLGGIELGVAAGWNAYRESTEAVETAEEFPDPVETETSRIDINDDEYTGTLYGVFGSDSLKVKAGVDLLWKTRDGLNDGDFVSASFRIEEKRYDPYVRLTYDLGSTLTIDAGLRYEITRRDVIAGPASASYDDELLNPSLHIRYAPTAVDQFRASLARTVRRPDYDLLSPIAYDETPGDDDTTTGNPALRNERAWGVDVGYERRLPGNGIFGINFFYRDITDLIELSVSNPTPGADGQDFEPRNIGDGQTWGVELDLSTPLGFIGLPDTGIFANYTYLDSRTTDPFTGDKRRFNAQPHHVYNAGFIQTVRAVDVSFGATVSGRSKSIESNLDEIVELRYDPDLELFVEKRLGRNFVVRASVQNLLDRVKYEDIRKYDGDSVEEILDERLAGNLDEYEIEREHSGPLFQITVRAAF